VDIEKSFTFPFEDKDWLSKLGLGALISMVPILNFAWSGYLVGVLRNVMNGVTEPLPTWDDLGKKFTDGLILLGAWLVYALPILIVFCLPMTILAFSGRLEELENLERMSEAGGALLACIMCVLFLYGMALSLLYPAILILFARDGTFASCFKLREAFDLITRNLGPFLTAWGLSIVANMGVGLVSSFINMVLSIIPCIGSIIGMALMFASITYTSVVYVHLFGQFGRNAFGQSQLTNVG
jgi:hypothetical protein